MVIGLFHRVSLHPDLPLYFAKFYTGKVTFQLMKPRLLINAGEILIQSTALTFEHFHTTSPNILDTAVPLSLWYHHKVTALIISTWRHGGHFGRGNRWKKIFLREFNSFLIQISLFAWPNMAADHVFKNSYSFKNQAFSVVHNSLLAELMLIFLQTVM